MTPSIYGKTFGILIPGYLFVVAEVVHQLSECTAGRLRNYTEMNVDPTENVRW